MQLDAQHDLMYGLNVHPGQAWNDQRRAADTTARAVRDAIAPDQPFALGLRLSEQAVRELAVPNVRDAWNEWLARERMEVCTINGFPQGVFHGAAVKDNVYHPDWRSASRQRYTGQLADVLADMLPDGRTGSISTVPVGYGSEFMAPDDPAMAARRLAETAAYLARLEAETGREIVLALEPEPDCLIESADGVERFFKDLLWTEGARHLHSRQHLSHPESILRRHIGVCLDLCHAAVRFESPIDALDRYFRLGLRVPKVQLSSALSARAEPDALERLRSFIDPVYLHQTTERTADGRIVTWPDLDAALEHVTSGSDLRVHFHVPLYFEREGPLEGTARQWDDRLFHTLMSEDIPHLEIETYTFDVLPSFARTADVEMDLTNSLIAEYRWAMKRLQPASGDKLL